MSTLRTIMTPAVVHVAPTMTAREAIDEMRSCRVPSAAVQLRGRVVGVIASDDLALFVRRGEVDTGIDRSTVTRLRADRDVALPVAALLERVLVEDVMSPRFLSLPPDADADAAVEMMRYVGDRQVLVMEGDQLFGIVHESDLAPASQDRGERRDADRGADLR